MTLIRKPYDRTRHSLVTSDEGGAQQSHAASCEINSILANYQQAGTIQHLNRAEPLYADLFRTTDLHTAVETVKAAQAGFDALPATVRAAALNDPVKFVEMLRTDEGRERLAAVGLVVRDQADPPPSLPPENTATTEDPPPPSGGSEQDSST